MLHATIHTLPSAVPAPCSADLLPLSVTFDSVAPQLEDLARMYFEPDGSFVWTGTAGGTLWQLEGQLQDRGERLDHVEIKGTCPVTDFSVFLSVLRTDGAPLAFQLVRSAVVIDEREALRLVTPG